MEVFGVLDVGSNSVRSLVAGLRGGRLVHLASTSRIVRLAEQMDPSGAIKEEAIEALREEISRIRSLFEGMGVGEFFPFATEAARLSKALSSLLEEELGAVEVLSPQREALSSHLGAAMGVLGPGGEAWAFDLGGGSLELSDGSFYLSLPMGMLRLKERLGGESPEMLDRISLLLGHEMSTLPPLPKGTMLLGVGGTSSCAAMIFRGIPVEEYHPAKVHSTFMPLPFLEELFFKLLGMDLEERASVRGMERGRVDTLTFGLGVIICLIKRLGLRGYVHSETGPMWGLLISSLVGRGLEVGGIDLL